MLNSNPSLDGITTHRLVVINHHEARIYHSEMHGSVPQRVLPHSPEDYFRHAPHSRDFARGQEKPDPNSFFAPIAAALKGAGQILLVGSGKGNASEMEQFAKWLHQHHPELSHQVLGRMVVDQAHLTEGELLAAARKFYASLPAR